MSSPTIQNLNKSNNTSRKSLSPMNTASNSLTKAEDNGILNNKRKTTTNQLKKNPEPVRRINLPYIQGISEQLQRTLSQHNVKSTFYTTTTLRKILPSPKDPIPTEKKHSIIYKLDCKDCDVVYIGESKEHIKHELENIYQQSEKLTPKGMKQQTTAGNSTITSTGQKIRSYATS